MSRNISIAPGEFFHIYQRGTDKRNIFKSPVDRHRFLALLYLSNSTTPIRFDRIDPKKYFRHERGETLVDIGTYCLMNNHFHIILHEKENGGISKFMHKLATAYSMYFNIKYERTGTLYEGPFKIKHLDTDGYLRYAFSYIHLNPVEIIEPTWKQRGVLDTENVWNYLMSYKDSGLLDYLGSDRDASAILHKEIFPVPFETPEKVKKELNDWLHYTTQDPWQGEALPSFEKW